MYDYYEDPFNPFVAFLCVLAVIGVLVVGVVFVSGCGSHDKAQAAQHKPKWPPDGVTEDGNVYYVENRLYDNRLVSLDKLCDHYFGAYQDEMDRGVGSIIPGSKETTVICIGWQG
jgi:hypothetical protein